MRLGISTHLFAFDKLAEGMLDLLLEFDYSVIEMWGMLPHVRWDDPAEVDRFARHVKTRGIDVATFHLPFYTRFGHPSFKWLGFEDSDPEVRALALSMAKAIVNICPKYDCDAVVLHGNGCEDPGDKTADENYRRCLDDFLPYCEKRGVRIAIENIMTAQSVTPVLRKLVDEYDSPYLWQCLDTGHAFINESMPEAVKTCGSRLLTTHIADNHGQKDEHLVPYFGNIDWVAAYRALLAHCPNLENFMFELMHPITGGEELYDDYRKILQHTRDAFDKMNKTPN